MPDTGNGCAAGGAAPLLNFIFDHSISLAPDQHTTALRAICILALVNRDVANVNVMQTFL
jgi:hypothetical protein